jgi:hypothetical protein
LQNEVDGLQKKIRIQDEQLQKADELNQEMLELRPKHWLTTEELRIKNEQLQQAETEIQRLKLENLELHKQVGNSIQPDIDSIRDRTLAKLKMGRQSAAGKAIDAFIKELRHKELPASTRTTAASLVKQAYKRYEKTGFVHTDVYENALRQIALQCGFKLLQDIKKKIFYITPKDDQGQRLITSSSIGGIVEFLSSQPLLSPEATKPWKVGDKCSVTMPSGVVIGDGVIASIQPERGTCKISVAETGSHFSAELANLSPI